MPTPILGPPPRRRAQPSAQYTRGRHLFLAEVNVGYFALRFSFGQHREGSTLILRESALTDTRHAPTRAEKTAHRWGDGLFLFGRDAGWKSTQRLWLRPSGVALLREWNQVHGDPFAPKPTGRKQDKTGQEQDK